MKYVYIYSLLIGLLLANSFGSEIDLPEFPIKGIKIGMRLDEFNKLSADTDVVTHGDRLIIKKASLLCIFKFEGEALVSIIYGWSNLKKEDVLSKKKALAEVLEKQLGKSSLLTLKRVGKDGKFDSTVDVYKTQVVSVPCQIRVEVLENSITVTMGSTKFLADQDQRREKLIEKVSSRSSVNSQSKLKKGEVEFSIGSPDKR